MRVWASKVAAFTKPQSAAGSTWVHWLPLTDAGVDRLRARITEAHTDRLPHTLPTRVFFSNFIHSVFVSVCTSERFSNRIVQSPIRLGWCVQGFAGWFETSAKDNVNIVQAAETLVTKILANDQVHLESCFPTHSLCSSGLVFRCVCSPLLLSSLTTIPLPHCGAGVPAGAERRHRRAQGHWKNGEAA